MRTNTVPDDSMIFECSDDDVRRLLLLASIGERVRNDWLSPSQWTEERQRDTDVLTDLCARAAEGRHASLVMRDADTGEWVPSAALEEETNRALIAYDEEVFWDQLIARMTQRDLLAEYGPDALGRLSVAHRQRAEEAMASYYAQEVERHGITRMQVRDEGRAPVRPLRRHNTSVPSTENVFRDFE